MELHPTETHEKTAKLSQGCMDMHDIQRNAGQKDEIKPQRESGKFNLQNSLVPRYKKRKIIGGNLDF